MYSQRIRTEITWAPGATVARLHGMQEVAGSNKLLITSIRGFANPAESTFYFKMFNKMNSNILVL